MASSAEYQDVEAMTTVRSNEENCLVRLDRHGYLFGKKLAKSLSPYLHGVIYDALNLNWAQVRLDSDNMDMFLKLIQHPQFYGASVTMPNKVAIIPHLDELTPECRAVGACNTIFLRTAPDGRRIYCGANTDVVGIRDSFTRNVDETLYADRPAMVIGGGGAARSAIYALRTWMRVRDIYVVNRCKAEVDAVFSECAARGFGAGLVRVDTVEDAMRLDGPGAIVACVPDFPPKTEDERRTRDIIEAMLRKREKGVMLEMCYNPTPFTQLGALAEGLGWKVILGTEAMIWQGLEQDRYWTGKDIKDLPVETVQRAIAKAVIKAPGPNL